MRAVSMGMLLSSVLMIFLLSTVPFAAAAPKGPAVTPLEQAEALIQAEEFGQAVAVLRAVPLEDRAMAARVDLLLGRIYLALGKPAKALEFFEAASFASLQDEAAAYLGLAEAKLALGALGQARRNAEAALRSDPDLVSAHLVLALIDQRLGQSTDAEARLEQLEQDRPDSEAVAIVAARYAAQNDSPDAGAARLARFVQQFPLSPAALDQLAQFEWAAGRRVAAVRARIQASRLFEANGQHGRVAAIAAWLNGVDPQGKLRDLAAKEPEPPPPIVVPPPTVQATRPVDPTPPPAPSSPPASGRKATVAPVLAQPEPLPFASGSPIMTGSGIVLEGGRMIVTNRHVVEGIRVVAVRNGTGHVRRARIARISSEDDLALLEIDTPFPEGSVQPFSQIVDANPGRPAIVMGYPLIGILGDEQPALTEGIVAKTMGLGNDPNGFQMTTKINKGNSGGPVFDRSGRLIGVAVAKVDVAGIFEKRGFLVEDMNLGIKASRILRFLGQAGRADQPDVPAEVTLEDLYQQMLPRVVLIAGQK